MGGMVYLNLKESVYFINVGLIAKSYMLKIFSRVMAVLSVQNHYLINKWINKIGCQNTQLGKNEYHKSKKKKFIQQI